MEQWPLFERMSRDHRRWTFRNLLGGLGAIAYGLFVLLAVLWYPARLVVVVATYWVLPAALWSAWPLLALCAAPAALGAFARLVGRCALPRGTPSFEVPAGQWLLERVADLGGSPGPAISVAELEPGNRTSFYHTDSRTIVLGEGVRDERTPRAYAMAAHELGHALLHRRWPRLSAWQLRCRRGARVFSFGMIALLGITLTGATQWLPLALGLIIVALAMALVTLLDEAAASALAIRELSCLATPAASAQIRRTLRIALSSYVAVALAVASPLALWPALARFAESGLLRPGTELSGDCLDVARVVAALMIAAVPGTLVTHLVPFRKEQPPSRWRFLTRLSALLATYGSLALPLFTATVAPTAAALGAAWAVLLTMVPTYDALAHPVRWIAALAISCLPELEPPSAPPPSPPAAPVRLRSLTRDVLASGGDKRLPLRSVLFIAAVVPLAVIALRM